MMIGVRKRLWRRGIDCKGKPGDGNVQNPDRQASIRTLFLCGLLWVTYT